jgi:hypothetical protein
LPFFGHPCRNCGVRSTARMRPAGSACDLPRSIGLASRALGATNSSPGGWSSHRKIGRVWTLEGSYALRYTTDDPRLCAGLDESQRRFRRGSRGDKPISHGSARELCGRRRYGAIDKLEHRGQRECRRNLRCMGTVGLCGAWARPVYRRLMWRPQRCTGVLRHSKVTASRVVQIADRSQRASPSATCPWSWLSQPCHRCCPRNEGAGH